MPLKPVIQEIKMNRFFKSSRLLIVVALFCMPLLFVAELVANELTATDLPRYDDGARWAFVYGKNTQEVAVIDTFEYRLAGKIKLKAQPIAMAVSDVQDLLVYIDGKTPKVYSYDLINHTHSEMTLSAIPNQMSFHADGAELAVALNNQIALIKPLKQEHVSVIDGLVSPFSMNYDNGGYNLYVTENKSGKTLIYRNHDGKKSILQLGEGPVSDISLSPDARLAMVSDYKTNSVFVWDLLMDQHYKSYPMDSAPWRPYVSADAEHMVFVSKKGQVQIFNTWSGALVNQFKIEKGPKAVRTGWLETIGIIESERYLNIFSLAKNAPVTHLALENPLNEVVVVSDSKTLFATQENSSELFIYDIRFNKRLANIDTGLKAPQQLVMGITNTICH